MAGTFDTIGWGNYPQATGTEQFAIDTNLNSGNAGVIPQQAYMSLHSLAAAIKMLGASGDLTTVAGSRYYVASGIGRDTLVTGIQVLVGGTGGTDLWIVELHDSTGALVATSTTAGTTAGTANRPQKIAFTAPYLALAGTYYIALQSNGTTAKPAVYVAPTGTAFNGSATGVFATGAAITPPTTYTQALGPVAQIYV